MWCLIEMGKECDHEEAAKIDSASKQRSGGRKGDLQMMRELVVRNKEKADQHHSSLASAQAIRFRPKKGTGIPTKSASSVALVLLRGCCGGTY